MYKLISVFIFLTHISFGQQKDSVVVIKDTVFSLKTNVELVRSDNLGNLYLIQNEKIMKLSPQGDTLFVSSNKLSGQITEMDVSFALKPLLFYQDQNMVSILDNTLSPQGENILLDDFSIFQPLSVCNSFSGNTIWIYNQDNFELIKLNSENGIEFRSGNLIQLTGLDMNITGMIEYKNKLYINNPEYGIMVFDIFGTYLKLIPVKHADHFQPIDELISYKKGNSYYLYSGKTFTTIKYSNIETKGWGQLNPPYFYHYSGEFLTVFKFN